MQNILKLENLSVSAEDKQILNDINLTVKSGEIHVIMGPNGSGKSTLAHTIMGHPKYKITSGKIFLNKKEFSKLKTEQRAKLGIFLGFQNPLEVSGIKLFSFLKTINPEKEDALTFLKNTKEKLKKLDIKEEFLERDLNFNFSGGEKKRSELLQMQILKPKFAILDEIDSGMDMDTLKMAAKIILKSAKEDQTGIILITHNTKILKNISPDFIHIIKDKTIIRSGDKKLLKEIEKKGFKKA